MNNYSYIQTTEVFEEIGIGKTPKSSIENAFLNFRSSLKTKYENDYITLCQTTSVEVLEEIVHVEIERFLFFFLPKEKYKYETKVKIKVDVNYINIQ